MAKKKSTKAAEVENDHLYTGSSPSGRARGRAAGRATKDLSSQAGRVARGGVGSSAQGVKRRTERAERQAANKVSKVNAREQKAEQKTAAREAKQKGIAERKNERLERREGRKDDLYKRDPRNTAKDDKAKAEGNKKREAAEKRQQAEAKAKQLEAQAKAAQEKAAKLKGKEKRAARDEAEKLEAQAKAARQQSQKGQDAPEQDHLYDRDRSPAAQARAKADTRREAKQEPLYTPAPRSVITESATSAPVSAPPVVTSSASRMHAACTAQAWGQLETQMALLS